jgi:tetratricopeptide (TPR) repeat protein
MRRVLIATLVVGTLLAGAGPACAGVYNLHENQDIWPLASSNTLIKLYLGELRNCDDRAQQPGRQPGPESQRRKILDQLAQLQLKQSADALCTLDRVNLGACLIRLGRNPQAVTVLEDGRRLMAPDDPARFLVLTNLATACYNLDLLPRAIGYQEQALSAWPTNWPGWTPDRIVFYRRAERYYLDLLRLRSKETGRWTSPDDLFPGVKFDDPREKYQAGAIPPRMYDRLPVEAPGIVLQLLISQPNDDRLYWLYGELFNAHGDVLNAAEIFKDLVFNRGLTNIPALTRHRQVLVKAIETIHVFQTAVQDKPYIAYQLFWVCQPRGGLASPGIGTAASEGASLLGPVLLRKWVDDKVFDGIRPPPPPEEAVTPPPPVLLDWRQIIVSFIAGILTAVFIRLQIVEWRRRPSSPASVSEPPPSPEPKSKPEREPAHAESGQTNVTS